MTRPWTSASRRGSLPTPTAGAWGPLHEVRVSDGFPVVLLHGFGTDHRLVRGLAEPAFAARGGWERRYLDLPGMGRSPAGPDVASTDDVVRVVLDHLDATLGRRPYALVGQSFGGGIARAVTAARRDQVAGLALIAPMVVADHARRDVPGRVVLQPDEDLLAGLDPEDAEEYAALAVCQDAATWARFRDEILVGAKGGDEVAQARIFARYALSVEPETTVDPYPGPALIVTGRQDHVAGYADPWRLLPHYPHAAFAALDRAGHQLQLEQPDLVTALLGEWLDRVPRVRRA